MSSIVSFIYTMEITCFTCSVKQSTKITSTRFYFLKFGGDPNHILNLNKFKIVAKRTRERVRREDKTNF